ncbi:hypothetical protein [Planctomicrobium sp. SH664]|uniref:hypothetical protein n=1 Tax=Planctomicrobium sp. SH664 TaxID=3448125 RepID=UPI003F5C01D5
MSFRPIWTAACLVAVLSGCQSFGGRTAMKSSWLGDPDASKSPADEPSDPWIQEAGTITRAEYTREEVNDPLGLRNVFMSQRARDIERNLGVGD